MQESSVTIEITYKYSTHVGWNGTLVLVLIFLMSILPITAIIFYRYPDRKFVWIFIVFAILYVGETLRYILCWKHHVVVDMKVIFCLLYYIYVVVTTYIKDLCSTF